MNLIRPPSCDCRCPLDLWISLDREWMARRGKSTGRRSVKTSVMWSRPSLCMKVGPLGGSTEDPMDRLSGLPGEVPPVSPHWPRDHLCCFCQGERYYFLYALLCITMHYYALQIITMHFYALLCITNHYYAFLCITMHYKSLLCISMH